MNCYFFNKGYNRPNQPGGSLVLLECQIELLDEDGGKRGVEQHFEHLEAEEIPTLLRTNSKDIRTYY